MLLYIYWVTVKSVKDFQNTQDRKCLCLTNILLSFLMSDSTTWKEQLRMWLQQHVQTDSRTAGLTHRELTQIHSAQQTVFTGSRTETFSWSLEALLTCVSWSCAERHHPQAPWTYWPARQRLVHRMNPKDPVSAPTDKETDHMWLFQFLIMWNQLELTLLKFGFRTDTRNSLHPHTHTHLEADQYHRSLDHWSLYTSLFFPTLFSHTDPQIVFTLLGEKLLSPSASLTESNESGVCLWRRTSLCPAQ